MEIRARATLTGKEPDEDKMGRIAGLGFERDVPKGESIETSSSRDRGAHARDREEDDPTEKPHWEEYLDHHYKTTRW